MSNSAVLAAEVVTKDYRVGAGTLPVLRGVSLDVRPGEVLAVVGRSGVGKSTLLHILGILDAPTSGRVLYKGEDLAAASPSRRAEVRNREFGFVFQFYHLLPEFTALENVLMPALVGAGPLAWLSRRRAARDRAGDLLRQVGLEGRARHRPSQLSGGEQQRVAIARALMNEPAILFCDEPTGNLDSATAKEIMALLFELNAGRRQTCVLVTHDETVARECHRVARMVDGRVAEVVAGRLRTG
ncbi:MAG: ABC transporter ATP-binding protein [Planctomycetales bacterium]|nr:ABC transporter ATP-binding protein [Planctomycetales bacterium]